MSTTGASDAREQAVLFFVSEIVAAYVRNNSIPVANFPNMIQSVHRTLRGLTDASKGDRPTAQKPQVPVKKSVTPDHIVCLEDGKKLKMLKRYVQRMFNLSPEEYRRKWGLPRDYPMVAPNYA